jgi:hypothetical protein
MNERLLADLVVLVHFAFVVFVVLGAALVVRWPKLAWVHLPAVAWGAAVEITGWICPLTPLENWLRMLGGGRTYADSFIAHYLMPVLYPLGLTRSMQILFGLSVVLINAAAYGFILYRYRRRSETGIPHRK